MTHIVRKRKGLSRAMRAYLRQQRQFDREQVSKLDAILYHPDPRVVRCENARCSCLFQADLNNESTCPHCGTVRAIRRH